MALFAAAALVLTHFQKVAADALPRVGSRGRGSIRGSEGAFPESPKPGPRKVQEG
jgi:hypothetical protein